MDINKVLVVDDSDADLSYIKKPLLATRAMKCLAAKSGDEAIVLAKQEKPDLIFMDIIMEGTDGYEACRILHRDPETKEIPRCIYFQ